VLGLDVLCHDSRAQLYRVEVTKVVDLNDRMEIKHGAYRGAYDGCNERNYADTGDYCIGCTGSCQER
jgi:hypothetical protein